VRGRPLLFTSYEQDQALLNTTTKKVMVSLFLLVLVLAPFGWIPFFGFLVDSDWQKLFGQVFIFAIAALGLNLLTGRAWTTSQLNQVLFGLLIIGFLIFEPLGLYGIWLRIRNYWKGWPFTY
jgi:ABC-type branched-subunit amino acid transport system permease subunit